MIKWINKYRLTLLGVAAGALGGYLYWVYVGCAGGTCPVTSSPVVSTLWGAAIGGLLFDVFKKKRKSDGKTM